MTPELDRILRAAGEAADDALDLAHSRLGGAVALVGIGHKLLRRDLLQVGDLPLPCSGVCCSSAAMAGPLSAFSYNLT